MTLFLHYIIRRRSHTMIPWKCFCFNKWWIYWDKGWRYLLQNMHIETRGKKIIVTVCKYPVLAVCDVTGNILFHIKVGCEHFNQTLPTAILSASLTRPAPCQTHTFTPRGDPSFVNQTFSWPLTALRRCYKMRAGLRFESVGLYSINI